MHFPGKICQLRTKFKKKKKCYLGVKRCNLGLKISSGASKMEGKPFGSATGICGTLHLEKPRLIFCVFCVGDLILLVSAGLICDLSVLFDANLKFGKNFGEFVLHRKDVTK